ncbi:MAG: MBL fold metallo-hydrolase [Peptostreptococcaceae bacterium]
MLKVLGSSSRGNCYILSTKKEDLIIECGIKYKEILSGLDYDLSKVVGCLVTHEHKDHCKAIEDIASNGINVYTSLGTVKEYFNGFDFIPHRINHVKSKNPFKVGNFTIFPFNTHHDSVEPLGFLIHHQEIGTLLFLTDTYYCDYNFRNINHILVECNYSKELIGDDTLTLRNRITTSHFELRNVIKFLKSNDLSKVRNIVLLHLSNVNGDGKYFKEEVEKEIGLPVEIARKGLEIDLSL